MKFKKIMSVAATAIMLGSTVAAAAYPAPFVTGGTADGAVVVGAAAAASDWAAAINLQTDLNSGVTSTSTSTDATVSGEAAALFSGGTKLYINDSLNAVKTVLTRSSLPTVLVDGSFSGNVDASITQTIDIGSNPRITFAKQPTSSDDPSYALTTSTTQSNYIYNATATFNKAVNFSHADSEGESLVLFGQSFTVGSATTDTNLVLLKSAEKLNLDSEANPSEEVTIDGEVYTIELVSSSDSAATIKVTDSSGASESKEIAEAASKKINGITVAVTTADETNFKLSASVVAGSDKITLTNGASVAKGEDDTVIDGTLVTFSAGTTVGNISSLTFSVYASESDEDAIKSGETFVDPVFGSFKLDFSGFNIESDSTTSRETISIEPNSDDKMDVTFTDHRGNEKSITWARNESYGIQLMKDDDKRNITVFEMQPLRYQDYVVVGNEDEGYLLKVTNLKNQTTGYNNDYVKFEDVFSGDTLETVWTSDGSGTLNVGGKSYTVTLAGNSANASEDYTVRLNYPDSSGTATAIIYPTIQTSKGARLAFYEPLTINLSSWNGAAHATQNLTSLKFPDGDGYTDMTIQWGGLITNGWGNISIDAGVTNLTAATKCCANTTIGQLKYEIAYIAEDSINVTLLDVVGGARITRPAIILFEEKDDNNNYEAIIVELEDGGTGDDGIGIDSVEDTWSNALSGWKATRASDSKMEDRGDLYGALMTVDSSDSDQKSATISYPDEQIYSQIYIAEEAASITAGTSSSGGGGNIIVVKDSEASSVSASNLVVVGGSCINTLAATMLDSSVPLCGSDFSDKTNVAAGGYLIKVAASPLNDAKIAMLVAGYNAEDTTNAVAKVKEGVDTTVGTETVYPIVSS